MRPTSFRVYRCDKPAPPSDLDLHRLSTTCQSRQHGTSTSFPQFFNAFSTLRERRPMQSCQQQPFAACAPAITNKATLGRAQIAASPCLVRLSDKCAGGVAPLGVFCVLMNLDNTE